MGCLVEIFTEIVFELLLEGLMALATWIGTKWTLAFDPDSQRLRKAMRTVAGVLIFVLFIVIPVGVILLLQKEAVLHRVGLYMTLIPLAIVLLLAVSGIVMSVIKRRKR